MSEETGSLTNFRAQSLIECSESSRSKLLPDAKIPVVDLAVVVIVVVAVGALGELTEHSWLGHHWSGDRCKGSQLFASSDLIVSAGLRKSVASIGESIEVVAVSIES